MNRPSATPVFVISLKRAKDRRTLFSERAGKAGLNWEFFDAHDGLRADLHYDEDEARTCFGRPLSPGELGVYSSHFSLWMQLLDSRCEQYIILEDDVIVDWKMLKLVAQARLADSNIHFLKLYNKRPVTSLVRKRDFIKRKTFLIESLGVSLGAQGYVITRDGARRLTAYCREVRRAIDDQMDRYWDHGIPNFCLFPFPVIEESVESTVGDDRYTGPDRSKRRKMYLFKDRWRRRAASLRRRAIRTIG